MSLYYANIYGDKLSFAVENPFARPVLGECGFIQISICAFV